MPGRPAAFTVSLAIIISVLSLCSAPASARTNHRPTNGHHRYVEPWVATGRVAHGHRHRVVERRRGERIYLRPRVIWVAWRPRPDAYWIDRRLREQIPFSGQPTMDGFACQYNVITAMDDFCVPR